MAKVIITAQVEDTTKWEEGFRTHGDLFKSQTITKMVFGIDGKNQVALYSEVEDLDTWREILESPATHEAMAFDGVKRDTVRVFMLDKELDL